MREKELKKKGEEEGAEKGERESEETGEGGESKIAKMVNKKDKKLK